MLLARTWPVQDKNDDQLGTGRTGREKAESCSPSSEVHALLLSVSEHVGERLIERSEALEWHRAILVARDRVADWGGGRSRSSAGVIIGRAIDGSEDGRGGQAAESRVSDWSDGTEKAGRDTADDGDRLDEGRDETEGGEERAQVEGGSERHSGVVVEEEGRGLELRRGFGLRER
jgi:hypothetical protein